MGQLSILADLAGLEDEPLDSKFRAFLLYMAHHIYVVNYFCAVYILSRLLLERKFSFVTRSSFSAKLVLSFMAFLSQGSLSKRGATSMRLILT